MINLKKLLFKYILSNLDFRDVKMYQSYMRLMSLCSDYSDFENELKKCL
jgi:hypothetical protein